MHRIDVHHHIVPREYLTALEKIGVKETVGFEFPEWSPEISIEAMDKNNIRAAVLSLSTPGVFFGDKGFAKDMARHCNEVAAKTVSDNPDRFGFFAALPTPITDASITEAIYSLDILKADGVGLLASSDGRFLGDPEYDALMDEFNRRKTIVFVHPNIHPTSRELKLVAPFFMVEFLADTTRAAANLLLTGTLEKYPDIKWILAHAGGTIPYMAWRLSLSDYIPGLKEKVPRGVCNYLSSLYYDTALSPSIYAMRSLEELADSSHILFGSDFPFAPDMLLGMEIEALSKPDLFRKATLAMVETENGLRLFPRFAEK